MASHGGVVRPSLVDDDVTFYSDEYFRIQVLESELETSTDADVDSFLSTLARLRDFTPRTSVHVDLLHAPRLGLGCRTLIGRLATAFKDAAFFQFRILPDDRSGDWWDVAEETFSACARQMTTFAPEMKWGCTFEGVLRGSVPERAVHGMTSSSVAARHVCRDAERDLSDDRCEDLLRVSRFGLRVPVVFYVDSGFMDVADELFVRSIQATQYSGLSLRHTWEDPLMAADEVPRNGVSPEEFLRVVAHAYKKFPHYDDVFEPVAPIMRRVDSRSDVKSQIRIMIDGDMVGIYHKIPSLRRSCGKAGDLSTMGADELRSRILRASDALQSADQECQPCTLRTICGGMAMPLASTTALGAPAPARLVRDPWKNAIWSALVVDRDDAWKERP